MRLWLYNRTSTDEDEGGQDVRAQEESNRNVARREGDFVAGSSSDDGVSGTVAPFDRLGFKQAVQAVLEGKAQALAIRDSSRFSRLEDPLVAMWYWRRLTVELGVRVVCFTDPLFTTGATPAKEHWSLNVARLCIMATNGEYAKATREGTKRAMKDIKDGVRPTRSGLPNGRPEVRIDPAHIEAAMVVYQAKGLAAAHREVLRLRGFNDAVDPKTKEKRNVGKSTVARALGVGWAAKSAQNPLPPKTPPAQLGDSSVAKGPLFGGRPETETESERRQEAGTQPSGQGLDSERGASA